MDPKDFFGKVNRQNLQRAKDMREELKESYWVWEVDCIYRQLHGSFKRYSIQHLTVKYLEALLALIGEEVPVVAEGKIKCFCGDIPKTIQKLKKIGFHPQIIKLFEEGMLVEFHYGEQGIGEWQKMSSAKDAIKTCLDTSIRTIENILDGKPPGFDDVWAFYDATTFYVFGLDKWRFSMSSADKLKILEHASSDVRVACKKIIADIRNRIRAVKKNVLEKVPIPIWEWIEYGRAAPQAKNSKTIAKTYFIDDEGTRYANSAELTVFGTTGAAAKLKIINKLMGAGFEKNKRHGIFLKDVKIAKGGIREGVSAACNELVSILGGAKGAVVYR
jgi:hypothetical protein